MNKDKDIFAYVMDRMQCREQCVGVDSCQHSAHDPTITFSRIFKWWLWIPDANEEVVRYVFTYNSVQLTGIYLARELAVLACKDESLSPGCMQCCTLSAQLLLSALNTTEATSTEEGEQNATTTTTSHDLFIPHATVPYADLTLRQYRDVMESIQWQWCVLIKENNKNILNIVSEHLDALFALFGYFVSIESGEDVFDDEQCVEMLSNKTNCRVLHATGVKMYVHLFYILYRSLFLKHTHTLVERKDVETELKELHIENFHVEASLDDFYNLTMYYDIAPACLLDYKHAYNGFFNNVSQAVYRHYPSYKRKSQETLQVINECLDQRGFDINILPCLRQLYPDVDYGWEDHAFGTVLNRGNLTDMGASTTQTWMWYCLAGDFFLVNSSGNVFAADNVVTLTAFYMKWLTRRACSAQTLSVLRS
jgi:hypothetical protein